MMNHSMVLHIQHQALACLLEIYSKSAVLYSL